MANYPYSSPPPPPSPCNNTTSPILLPSPPPPPPPPPPACNHTSTPTLSPPPQSHYSHSPPSLSSPSPTPSPACTCNKNTTALPPPPPPPPLPSPPPPSPPSYYHSPPLASPSPPPPPPSTHYSPPVHSPPPPTPSYPSPPPPSQSPPKPSKTQASPAPLLQPTTPPPSSSPYYFPQTPLHSPQSPDPPLCHCVCPSPSIPPNYYDSIAPAPLYISPSNGQRTVIVTTFVSLGGVFFLSFIVIGLLSMAMKKRMPRMSGREQPDSHVQTQGDVHKFESIPAAAGTSTEHSAIDMGDHGLDPKPVENPKVQQVVTLPDQGAGKLVEQALHQTSNPNVTDKKSSDTEFRKPSGEQSATNMDAPQGADEGNLDKSKSKLLDDQSVTDNADTSPNVEKGSQEVGDESNDSKKKLRLPKKKKSPSNNAKKGNEKRSGVRQVVNVASVFVQDEAQHSQDGDDDEERASESEPHDHHDKELIASASHNTDENVEQPASDEQDAEERDDKSKNVEERSVGEESNDSKQKLRLRNKEKAPNRVAKKEDKRRSRVRQGVNVACTLVLGEAQQSQDGDDDEERASESEPHDEGEEFIAGASNNTDENVEQPDADEKDAEERDDKPLTHQNVEESPIGEESNDSKQKLRLPNKKKPLSRVAKKEDNKRSRVRQGMNVVRTSVLGEAQQSQDGDDDEERASESEPHDEDEELIAGASHNTDENVEQPDADEQDAEERDDKPLTPQNVEESPIGEESNDSKQKLRLPNKKKPPSRVAKKEDKERSRVRQGVNVARTSVLDEAQQSQDGDDDEERASESEPHDEDEELITGASNNTDENVEQPTADEQDVKHDDKPFSHQTETHSRDSRQNMEEGSDAVGEESNDSKHNLHLPKKKKSPRSGAKKGNTQPYGVCQVLNPPNIYDPKEVENSQVGDNDEEPYESEPQDDDEELIPGGSNITDEIVEQPTTDEQEADEHDNKRLSHQTWASNRDSGQNVEEGFNAAGEESSYSKKKLRLPKKKNSLSSGEKKGDEKRYGVRQVLNVASTFIQDEPVQSQDGDNKEEQVSELDAQNNDKALFLGGLTSADEKVEHSTADEQEADECDDKTFSHQTETNNRNSGQNVEEGSNAVIEEQNDSKNKSSLAKKKRSPSSGAKKGNEKSSSSNVAKKENEQPYGIRQVLSPASIFDSEGVEKSQDDNINEEQCELQPQDGEEPYELEPHDDEEPYEEVQPQPNEEQSRRQEDDNDDVEVEESECVHDGEESNSCANDSSRVMVSLDDLEGKLKVSDPFSSARGSKQALSKTMGVVGDGKAKVHELKSGGSNKDSQGRQHHTQIREAKKPLNFGKIGTAASDSDPGKALVIFDNEDDRAEESEPFASNVDSYLGQLQTSARGTEQSPNIFQNLTSTIDDDPAEGLKSLGDGHYKGKKAVHQLSKDSRRIKGQIIPPNRSEIVTTKIGDDLGKGLESLGGNQREGSEKDGSSKDVPGSGQTSRGTQQLSNLVQILAATNEGDPNPEPGVYEDDKEYLSLEEPSPGEMEPSTDDQSASVTVDDDDPDVLQFHNNEYDEESAESNKDAPPGKPLSRPRTTNLRGKRRA